MGIPIYSKTLDLCTLLSEAHAKDPAIQECPIKPYTQKKVTFNEMIPNTFTSGTANVTDQSGNVVQCVQFDMKISDGSIVAPYIPHVPLWACGRVCLGPQSRGSSSGCAPPLLKRPHMFLLHATLHWCPSFLCKGNPPPCCTGEAVLLAVGTFFLPRPPNERLSACSP